MSTKRHLADLALFSGEPAFTEPLHVGRPNVGERARLLARIEDILDRRWLTNDGRYVRELEERLAALFGVEHCVAVCNATVGLEILLAALDLAGEVIVPSFTFVATAHAVAWRGLTPRFCDIDPRTHNLDPVLAEALITERTSAILGVHLWGRACAVEELTALARRRNLRLVFDAAHAFACAHRGRMIGGFGDAEVFSLHATKLINTFEGGVITTNDARLAERLRLMRNFGFVREDEVVSLGTNGKLNEAAAAMGLTGLESLDEIIAVNRRNHERYRLGLQGLPGVTVVGYDESGRHNYHWVVCEIDEQAVGISRDALVEVLRAENVLGRRYFFPGCHRMEPYRSRSPELRLPHTEALAERVLSLPNGPAVGDAAIELICRVIALAVQHGGEVAARLRERG